MSVNALAALPRDEGGRPVDSLQVGCIGEGRPAEGLRHSALFGLAGTVRPVPSRHHEPSAWASARRGCWRRGHHCTQRRHLFGHGLSGTTLEHHPAGHRRQAAEECPVENPRRPPSAPESACRSWTPDRLGRGRWRRCRARTRALGCYRPGLAVSGVVATVGALVASNGPMTMLGITDLRTWTITDWVSDVIPHLAYGAATAGLLRVLERAAHLLG